jgi:hypothetical protein
MVDPWDEPVTVDPPGAWTHELEALHAEAVRRFGASCLWSMPKRRSIGGPRAMSEMLRNYFGMDAWRHAAKIRKAVGVAAR